MGLQSSKPEDWEEISFAGRDPLIEGTVARMKLRSLAHVCLSEETIVRLTTNTSNAHKSDTGLASESRNGKDFANNDGTDEEDFDDSTTDLENSVNIDNNNASDSEQRYMMEAAVKAAVKEVVMLPRSERTKEEYVQKMEEIIRKLSPAQQQQYNYFLFLTQQQSPKLSQDDGDQLISPKSVETLKSPSHSVNNICTRVPFQCTQQESLSPTLELGDYLEIDSNHSVPRSCANCINQPFDLVLDVLSSLVSLTNERADRIEYTRPT
jgi:hypothetical protein